MIVGVTQHPGLGALCEGFAEQGYEVVAPEREEGLAGVIAGLDQPVMMLAIGGTDRQDWVAALQGQAIAAASLFEPPLELFDEWLPPGPAIAHFALGGGVCLSALDQLRDRRPEMGVYPYAVAPGLIWRRDDGARLARLRTLQLFHRSSGTRGEMGG